MLPQECTCVYTEYHFNQRFYIGLGYILPRQAAMLQYCAVPLSRNRRSLDTSAEQNRITKCDRIVRDRSSHSWCRAHVRTMLCPCRQTQASLGSHKRVAGPENISFSRYRCRCTRVGLSYPSTEKALAMAVSMSLALVQAPKRGTATSREQPPY